MGMTVEQLEESIAHMPSEVQESVYKDIVIGMNLHGRGALIVEPRDLDGDQGVSATYYPLADVLEALNAAGIDTDDANEAMLTYDPDSQFVMGLFGTDGFRFDTGWYETDDRGGVEFH